MKKNIINNRETFDNLKNYLIDQGSEFLYTTSGSINTIIHKDVEWQCVNTSENAGKGHHISRMVQKDIDIWIQQNKSKLQKHQVNYKEQLFNLSAIESGIGKPLVMIDIDSCYWQTAYKLTYITEQTYVKGRKKKEWKTGRNASIGALCKTKYIVPFSGGSPLYRKRTIQKTKKEYQYIRNHIINSVYNMFFKLYELMPDNFYMFLTDSIVTSYDKKGFVEDYFMKEGYKVKSKPVEFTSLNREKKQATWYDFTAEVKNAKGEVIGTGKERYYQYAPHQVIDGLATEPKLDFSRLSTFVDEGINNRKKNNNENTNTH